MTNPHDAGSDPIPPNVEVHLFSRTWGDKHLVFVIASLKIHKPSALLKRVFIVESLLPDHDLDFDWEVKEPRENLERHVVDLSDEMNARLR